MPADPTAPHPAGDITGLAATVTQLRRALRRRAREVGPAGQLPLAQVELLQHLAEHPGARVGDVAAELHLAGNTVSTLARQLTAAGLVTRAPDGQDRRAVTLHTTPAGSRYLAAWQQLQGEVIATALGALDAPQHAALAAALPALSALVAAVSAETGGTRSAQPAGPPAT